MPEDKKMAVEKENTSPAKSKTPTISRSGNTLAQVTMLDGSVLDVNIEVNLLILMSSLEETLPTYQVTNAFKNHII